MLTYPAKTAPSFKKGFIFSSCAYVAQFGITGTVWWLQRWELRKDSKKAEEAHVEENQPGALAIADPVN